MDTTLKTSFLERERIFTLLLKLGVPATAGMLVNALYNIVDTIFVGLGVGPLAIAALSIAFPIQMIVSSLAQALGVGAASIVSRRLGEKRPEEAARTMGTAYTAILVVTAVLVALLLSTLRPVLAFFGASEAIMPYAQEYTAIVGAGFFFFASSMAASSLIRAEGNAKASMIGMLIGALLNCVLDPLFIFGLGMGVAGAAWATVISQAAACAYLFSRYLLGKTHVPLGRRDFRIRPDLLRESALLGIPVFLQSAGMSILVLLINNTLGTYGGDRAITIYGMNTRMVSLIIFPLFGIVQAFQPIVGYNYGARRYDRVRSAIRITAATMFSVAIFFFALTMLFPGFFMGMFSRDPDLVRDASGVLRMMMLFIPLVSFQFIGSTYFQSIGKKTESMVLGLARQFLMLIPLVLIMPRFFGLVGVWTAFPTADFLSSVLTGSILLVELRRLGRRSAAENAAPKDDGADGVGPGVVAEEARESAPV